jgi:CheY-like chemotaxis protein
MGLFLSALRSRETDRKNIHIIDDMSKSAEALNSLFSSLLDVSRLDAEIIDFNPEHVGAAQLFDALRAQFEQRAAEKGIQLYISTDKHVLHCDPVLLERVLRNLLTNAIRYTNNGSISLRCNDWQNGAKQIIVEDTGIGIPAEFTEDVFSEYYQLNNPGRDREKGLGLGLSIVRRLCELMDLPLHMQSEEGNGTVFTVVVPGGDPAKLLESATSSSVKVTRGHRVLVIDDELQVLKSMQHMLEGWGCNVMLAESARDALKVIALSDDIPTVIISDYRLGDELNGVDAVAAVRESIDAFIPAIIVSGDTSPERLKEVKESGHQLLHKPVHPDDLSAVLQSLCGNISENTIALGRANKPGFTLPAASNQ